MSNTTKTSPARARSFRLTQEDESLLDQLVAHFSGPIPATPSDVFRLALRRLAEAELGDPKKSSRKS